MAFLLCLIFSLNASLRPELTYILQSSWQFVHNHFLGLCCLYTWREGRVWVNVNHQSHELDTCRTMRRRGVQSVQEEGDTERQHTIIWLFCFVLFLHKLAPFWLRGILSHAASCKSLMSHCSTGVLMVIHTVSVPAGPAVLCACVCVCADMRPHHHV